MEKRKRGNFYKLLLGAALAAAVIGMAACSNPTSGGGGSNTGYRPARAPERPVLSKIQDGFELLVSDLNNASDADALVPEKLGGVVAFTWIGEGATEYSIYWDTENARPAAPNASGVKQNSFFARNLEEDTEYYFWIEAKNSFGSTFSDSFTRTTGLKGPYASGGKERGDYPRNIKLVPGSGALTVSWDLSDRVGWYEVYYAPAGTINHVDAYDPIRFAQSGIFSAVAYGDAGMPGYTRAIYPFCSPLAGNNGYEGYYIGLNSGRDSDTRPVMGINDMGKTEEDAGFHETFALFPPAGSFPYIFESWKEGEGSNDLGRLSPYKPLHAAFADAVPWDGVKNKGGTPGTSIKYFATSVTITGLTNGTAYEVWIRCPNANGERGYGYVVGTPGGGTALPVPAGIAVSTPENTTRELSVSWQPVEDAVNYRVYASKFGYTPTAAYTYTLVPSSADPLGVTVKNLSSGSEYYVWVVAEKDGIPGIFGKPVTGKTGTAPAAGSGLDKTIAGTDQKVKTAVYIEVNDRNPLNAGSYILEDGSYLFDYVIIFAANIRSRNCALEIDQSHGCTLSGPHLHLNENVRYILQNRNKYIVPLQQKGIKVLLGLLGDHDGIGFGAMTDTEIDEFIASVKAGVELYHLDGIDFDDEWASREDWDMSSAAANPSATSIWTYPATSWGWPFSLNIYRNPAMGIEPGNGIRSPAPSSEDQNRMWAESGETYFKTIMKARAAMPDKVISLYEYNSGRYITAGAGGTNPTPDSTATMDDLRDAIDFAMQPWYNQYRADSANSLPRGMYSPFGMDLSGFAYASFNGAAYPPIANTSGDKTANETIYDYSTRFKTAAEAGNPYNVLYFYGLEENSRLVKTRTNEASATTSREEYISNMTRIIFDQDCVLTADGGDYRKDW